jgi:hypothetical protein
MDGFLFRSKSNTNVNSRDETFHELIFRKFKFLRSLKNYILSKIRTGRYELNNGADQEISIISYDQRSFADVERDFDLQTPSSVSSVDIDGNVIELLKTVLDKKFHDNKPRQQAELELLEIIEKTFTRQLDIFEGVLKLANSRNIDSKKLDTWEDRLRSSSISEKSVDGFINGIIKNLVTEITKNAPCSDERLTRLHSSIEKRSLQLEENLGDNLQVKKTNVLCECQEPTSSGAAVSRTLPSHNFY